MTLLENDDIGLNETERVAFNCHGCGRPTVIHIGRLTIPDGDKRCLSCRALDRKPLFSGDTARSKGTHEGRIKTPERRAVKRAAAARNRMRRGLEFHAPCRSYGECNHRKHSVADGHR